MIPTINVSAVKKYQIKISQFARRFRSPPTWITLFKIFSSVFMHFFLFTPFIVKILKNGFFVMNNQYTIKNIMIRPKIHNYLQQKKQISSIWKSVIYPFPCNLCNCQIAMLAKLGAVFLLKLKNIEIQKYISRFLAIIYVMQSISSK